MTPPIVSVLMPVYNAERYVAEAVESILSQTFADIEFLIIDDGSTDSSLRILRHYEERDARIRLVSRPNTGYVIALNEMLAAARGEFIARMDADDISLPERLAEQVALLRSRPDVVAVGGRIMLIDEDGSEVGPFCQLEDHEDIDQAHLSGVGGAIAHPAAVIRRSAMLRTGGYRPEFMPAEDLDLFLRLGEIGRLANVPALVLRYRLSLSSVSNAKASLQAQKTKEAVEQAMVRRGSTRGALMSQEGPTATVASTRLKWAWWALAAGNVATARKHAAKAVLHTPLSPQAWRAMACAVRGR